MTEEIPRGFYESGAESVSPASNGSPSAADDLGNSVRQFDNAPMWQELAERREIRLDLAVPVLVAGADDRPQARKLFDLPCEEGQIALEQQGEFLAI